jgi:2-polyprenyl-3-methyl-5-hydroxy-6-metoxy-1,4-benzoquinol methylase
MAGHVCPWWLGYFLASPLRKLRQDPRKILAPYLEPGMTALDAGCGMGFFSFDMAGMVKPGGRVVCVDLQEKMIRTLLRRASKRGISKLIEARICSAESLGVEDLEGRIDFALAFAIVHETPDAASFLEQLHAALKPGGSLLLSEPRGHVSRKKFEETMAIAYRAGFERIASPKVRGGRTELLVRR